MKTPGRTVVAVGLATVAVLAAACGSSASRLDVFCAVMDELRSEDPFGDLTVASDDEIHDAFASLASQAGEAAAAAPESARSGARRYADAIERLRELLGAAGYDPRRVDAVAYSGAARDYEDAAVALDGAARAACPAS